VSTVPPVNARACVVATFVDDIDGDTPIPAGQWSFYKRYSDPDDAMPAGILFGCPCGCGEMKSVGFDTHESRRPRWHWDGNRERPTLTPSINILQLNDAGQQVGEHWHGWLTAGEFRSC